MQNSNKSTGNSVEDIVKKAKNAKKVKALQPDFYDNAAKVLKTFSLGVCRINPPKTNNQV